MQERGWAGLKNGPLLGLMHEARVEAFITTDRNLEYQQNVAAAGFAVVALVALTNTLEDLLPLVPALLVALERPRLGQVTHVGVYRNSTVCSLAAGVPRDRLPDHLELNSHRERELRPRAEQVCRVRQRQRLVGDTEEVVWRKREGMASEGMKRPSKSKARFAVCIENKGYEASLEIGKLYRVIPDQEAQRHGYLRIVDESGEDYGYAASRFFSIDVPKPLERVLLKAAS